MDFNTETAQFIYLQTAREHVMRAREIAIEARQPTAIIDSLSTICRALGKELQRMTDSAKETDE